MSTPNKKIRLTTVNNNQLGEIEDHNMAKRVEQRIRPELKRRELTSVPHPYPFREQESEDYYPVPDWVEVIPDEGQGVEQLSGGRSRALQNFRCEKCGFTSSRFSMFAMVYDDNGQFAMRRASDDEAKLIVARSLATLDFEVWAPGSTQTEYEQRAEEHQE